MRRPAHAYGSARMHRGYRCYRHGTELVVRSSGASAAVRLERALAALGVDHDVKVYPDAGHGFIKDHDPADMTLLLTILNKVSGTRYHAPSATDAHRRIAAFFHRHLTA